MIDIDKKSVDLARRALRRSSGSFMCTQHDQSAQPRCFALPELVKISICTTSASIGRAHRSTLGVDDRYRQKIHLARRTPRRSSGSFMWIRHAQSAAPRCFALPELVKISFCIICASIGPAHGSSLGVDAKYRQKIHLARRALRRSSGSFMCIQHDQSAQLRCFALPELFKIPFCITSVSIGPDRR